MAAQEFLLEIGTEEIPAWMIEPALNHLRRLLLAGLGTVRLGAESDLKLETYATARRLVLYCPALPARQPDAEEWLVGPPKAAPPQAAESFARKMGVEVSRLKVRETPKGEYWAFHRRVKGKPTRELLQTLLPDAVLGIHFPKTMYWTGKNGPRFIRPIRWLLALYGGRVVPFEIAGVASSRYTFGHRAMGKGRLKVTGFEQYVRVLQDNGVILKPSERREKILADASALLGCEGDGLRLRDNPELLNTLVYLTESPTASLGQFDPAYLELPEEVLVTVMQHHQKYLSVSGAEGRLAPRFIFVMNLDGAAAGDAVAQIRHGHERVLRARFNDARFFWDTDAKTRLQERLELLKSVTFQSKLGSYFDKANRMRSLAGLLVDRLREIDGEKFANIKKEEVQQAALLAKCDLTTELVKEFPELQGVVGGLYARREGLSEAIASAIYNQYKPQNVEDSVPPTLTGALISVADRLDTLVGLFGIGLVAPSGSKDPFALRRAAMGVWLIGGYHQLPLTWGIAVDATFQVYDEAQQQGKISSWTKQMVWPELEPFIMDRRRYYLKDILGFPYDEVNAISAVSLVEDLRRLEALHRIRQTENFEPLAAAFKRIRNILTKAGGAERFAGEPDASLLEPGAETELYAEACRIAEETRDSADYESVLRQIAALRPWVDAYFDQVLVMANDERVRQNRLTLLAWLLRAFTRIADFSEIVVSKDPASTG